LIDLIYQNTKYQYLNLQISQSLKQINKDFTLVGMVQLGDIKSISKCINNNIEKIFFFHNNLTLFTRYHIYLNSLLELKKINTIKKLLNYKKNYISLGKIIYDQAIKLFNVGSIKTINKNFFSILVKALLAENSSNKIFSSKKILFLVQAEKHWIPANIIFQNALKYKTNVLCRIGDEKSFSTRLYNDFSKNFQNKAKISNKLFNYVYKKINSKKINYLTNKLLKVRFNRNLLCNQKKIKNKFCKEFNISPKKPLVCIYSNNLTDGIYSNSWQIFQDNLTWLLNTLNICIKKTKINWIIKAHPLDNKKTNIRTTQEYIVDIVKKSKNIIFLDHDNSNSKILHNIIDVGITAHGSVSVELPSIGIPCIIAGESFSSGHGFNIEPRNMAEYFQKLKNIEKLKKLNKSKIYKARVFYFIYNYLIKFKFAKNNLYLNREFLKSLKNQIYNKFRHPINEKYKKFFNS